MSFFKSFAGKLSLLAGVSILGLIVSSLVAYRVVSTLDETIGILSNKRVPITRMIGDVRIHMNAISRMTWQAVATTDLTVQKEVRKKIENRLNELHKTIGELDQIGLVPKNKANLEMLKKAWEPLEKKYQQILAQAGKGESAEALQEMMSTSQTMDELAAILVSMGEVMLEANLKVRKESTETADQAKFTLLILAAGFILFSAIFAAFLIFNLTRIFRAITSKLGDSGGHVSSASDELAKASTTLSSASAQAAASLEETVASLEEINSQVLKSSELATEAGSLSGKTLQAAQKGDHQIQDLLKSMSEIENSSGKIQEIINMIDDIAFQTNLLSLNAAVEAARAGEHGKGFAVVAEAVRALSQRSATSAKEISTLIQESVDKTTQGVRLARQSSEAVSEIIRFVEHLAQLNKEVAAASEEQALGIKQISQATNQLDSATQSNASTSEEAAATAEELSAQSRELYTLVQQLSQIIEGRDKRAAA